MLNFCCCWRCKKILGGNAVKSHFTFSKLFFFFGTCGRFTKLHHSKIYFWPLADIRWRHFFKLQYDDEHLFHRVTARLGMIRYWSAKSLRRHLTNDKKNSWRHVFEILFGTGQFAANDGQATSNPVLQLGFFVVCDHHGCRYETIFHRHSMSLD